MRADARERTRASRTPTSAALVAVATIAAAAVAPPARAAQASPDVSPQLAEAEELAAARRYEQADEIYAALLYATAGTDVAADVERRRHINTLFATLKATIETYFREHPRRTIPGIGTVMNVDDDGVVLGTGGATSTLPWARVHDNAFVLLAAKAPNYRRRK